MLGDLLKLMRSGGAFQWELAAQLAQSIATGDSPPRNVDPVERIRFEELSAIAALHVAAETGMGTDAGPGPVLTAVTKAEWATTSLEQWRGLLDGLAAAAGAGGRGTGSADGPGQSGAPPWSASLSPDEGAAGSDLSPLGGSSDDERDLFSALFAQWAEVMTPAMIAVQVGSIVGHLALTSFGQFDLPLPRQSSGRVRLLVLPENLGQFAEDWSIPLDDARLWLCLRELACHAVLDRAHVSRRLSELVLSHSASVRPDPAAIEAHLEGLDLSDLGAMLRILGDPATLAGSDHSGAREQVQRELDTLVAVIGGYVDHITTAASARLLSNPTGIEEAIRRRRVTRGEGERTAEALFGMKLDQDQFDRGRQFIRGVLERGGDHELAKLWVVEGNLPTPSELVAPGLWIERVNLPSGS
jgi:putative hydrolase